MSERMDFTEMDTEMLFKIVEAQDRQISLLRDTVYRLGQTVDKLYDELQDIKELPTVRKEWIDYNAESDDES